MGDSSYSFFVVLRLRKMQVAPQKRHKNARGNRPRVSVSKIRFTLESEGATQSVSVVLGVCPPGYWDSRPRRSPPNSMLDRIDPMVCVSASLSSHAYNTAIFSRCQGKKTNLRGL